MGWLVTIMWICVILVVIFVIRYFKLGMSVGSAIASPLRKVYIGQIKKMINDYNITKEELFGRR